MYYIKNIRTQTSKLNNIFGTYKRLMKSVLEFQSKIFRYFNFKISSIGLYVLNKDTLNNGDSILQYKNTNAETIQQRQITLEEYK